MLTKKDNEVYCHSFERLLQGEFVLAYEFMQKIVANLPTKALIVRSLKLFTKLWAHSLCIEDPPRVSTNLIHLFT